LVNPNQSTGRPTGASLWAVLLFELQIRLSDSGKGFSHLTALWAKALKLKITQFSTMAALEAHEVLILNGHDLEAPPSMQ
jgi:hypothetical protein